ncbi:4-alpha-glucanotransferase [Antarcticibacterium sp. 1MA-6-2]|uniref:4-alpha-glucanotransferase n=1 Tax=Antarcticibacterium sp. 1MA-6-2 TaxID=2908210 RepID=UPI0021079BEF|nr:4-alpha-glucanotransferase [Antarcticibacterium sp. 1MA-6-2]
MSLVYKLLEKFNFPGMNVLQFAFGEEKRENPYLPFNHKPHSIVYTGTHDNNTTKGWFKGADKAAKKHLRKYTGHDITKANAHEVMHKLALQSVAKIAVVPMQDILGLGKKGLMNIPGSTKGNWSWRLKPGQLPVDRVKKLKSQNKLYGRYFSEKKKDQIENSKG